MIVSICQIKVVALKADAILCGHNDMEQGDLDLISLLVSVNRLTAMVPYMEPLIF